MCILPNERSVFVMLQRFAKQWWKRCVAHSRPIVPAGPKLFVPVPEVRRRLSPMIHSHAAHRHPPRCRPRPQHRRRRRRSSPSVNNSRCGTIGRRCRSNRTSHLLLRNSLPLRQLIQLSATCLDMHSPPRVRFHPRAFRSARRSPRGARTNSKFLGCLGNCMC